MNKKQKTPEYTRRAIEKYHLKFARFTISTPREVKDRLNAVLKAGESANALINDLLLQEIERREADLQQEPHTAPQEATQAAKAATRTNTHEANESSTEGRTDAQEGTTTAGTAGSNPQEEPRTRGRSKKGSGATAGSSKTARREPVDAADTGTKATPGDNLQQYFNPYKYNADHLLLYPYDTDDIPPEELPFH